MPSESTRAALLVTGALESLRSVHAVERSLANSDHRVERSTLAAGIIMGCVQLGLAALILCRVILFVGLFVGTWSSQVQ